MNALSFEVTIQNLVQIVEVVFKFLLSKHFQIKVALV